MHPADTLHIKSNHLLYILTGSLIAILSGFLVLNFLQILTPDNSYAETHTDSASGAYNGTTYSVTTTVSDLNLELYNVTPAGKATYGKQTVNVTTNAPGGYQLYVQTSGNLAGTKEGTATSDSIAALPSNNSALDMNTWGYTKTTPNEDTNIAATESIWNTPPSTITQVDATSSAATSGRDTDIYYGIKADNTLSGDNYSGTITYTTIANDATTDTLLSVSPTSGNAGTATKITVTTSLMTTSSGISASDISATVGSYSCSSIAITSTSPLIFICNTSTSLTAGTYTVTATISKYGKTYTKTSAYTANTASITDNMTFQQITRDMCKATPLYSTSNKTYTIKDSRDNNTYSVRKLADGNCWMTQNLRLINKSISASDSNVSSSFTIPASSTSTGTSAGTWGTTDNANGINHTAAQYNNNTTYGAYYNWYTATAGSGTYNTSSGVSVDYSICPKSGSGNTKATSWHLPTGMNTGEWYKMMITSYGYKDQSSSSPNVADWTTTAPNLPFSGYVSNGSLYNTGFYGYFWSSTAYDSTNGYRTYVDYNKYLRAGTYNIGKRYGLSVRCVLTAAS